MKSLQERKDYLLEKNIISSPVLRQILNRSDDHRQASCDLVEVCLAYQAVLNSMKDYFFTLVKKATKLRTNEMSSIEALVAESCAWEEARSYYHNHPILSGVEKDLTPIEKKYLQIS